MTSKERRHAARTISHLNADLYDPKGRMVIGEGHFINMSERGALMQSEKPLKPRQSVRLHVQNPVGQTALELRGKVVWARKKRPGFTYGIAFAEL